MSQNLALAMRRQDSNRMALRAVRSILAAAHPLELTIEGTRVEVAVERLPPLAWPPGGLMGLEEAVDGPLPPSARLRCSWPGGEVELLLSVVWWNSNASNRHLICLRLSVASPQRELIWITVAGRLAETQEGNVTLHAWFSPAPRRDEDKAELLSTYGLPVRLAVQRSGLPNVTNARVDVFAVDVETGEVAPSAEEAYRRLVHLGLLKLPLILRGQYESVVGKPLYDLGSLAAKGGSMHAPLLEKPASEKRLGIGTMPGGVREYKKTLDALLQALAGQSLSKEDFIALLRERYGVQSPHAWHSYGTVLENLGVVTVTDGHVTLSPAGEAYLQDPSPQALFELLHRAFQGILETLVIVEQGGGDSATVRAQLLRLLGVSWEKTEQSGRRRDWLLSLGATERSGGRDTLTELGLALLAVHGEEAESIRHALREGSVVEEEEGEADGRGEEDALEKSVARSA